MKNAETKFTEIVEQFKAEQEKITSEAISRIHSEMVPYLNEDTANNANYRAAEMVRSIIRGNFEFDGKKISVDGWTIDRISDFDYDKFVDVLSAVAGDSAKDAKIARLERQIAELNKYMLSA